MPVIDRPKAPVIRTDTIEPCWHPSTGEYYTSMSQFRRATKAAGCIEVGNEWVNKPPPPAWQPESCKEELIEVYKRYRDGQLTEEERHLETQTVSEFEKEHGEIDCLT